jgi:hypothetical protein
MRLNEMRGGCNNDMGQQTKISEAVRWVVRVLWAA